MESTLFVDLINDELYDLEGGNVSFGWRDVYFYWKLSGFILESLIDLGKGYKDGFNGK